MRDTSCCWPGSAYDALAPAAITTDATTREILDASFELMAKGLMAPEVRQAWDELRHVPRRLVVDFLWLAVDLPREIDRARQALDAGPSEGEDPPRGAPGR
jgi:hypothetical protein